MKHAQLFKALLGSSVPVFMVLVLAGYAAGQLRQAPDETRLQERVMSVHTAIGQGDVEQWYAMTPPSVRKLKTLSDFKRDIRWDAVVSKRPPYQWQARVGELCSCRQETVLRCVVLVNVNFNEPPGHGPAQDWVLESWDYTGEDWYLFKIGASTGGHCPGQ